MMVPTNTTASTMYARSKSSGFGSSVSSMRLLSFTAGDYSTWRTMT